MTDREPIFTIGIEEEYLLVDAATGELASDPPEALMRDCVARFGDQVSPEFLRSQVEVGTAAVSSVKEVRAELVRLRRGVAEAAAGHGLKPIAAGTHPFADHEVQPHTEKERYEILARELQGIARRLLISGMHVHVGIENRDLRIDLMGQVSYFLPHLLALSTSSPYWRGIDTGLMSYRIAVWDELPRTGMPEEFDSWSEFERFQAKMQEAGLIEDGSKLWWDLRPSVRHPTLEMRICDMMPRLDDTICVAALYLCLLRMLWRLRTANQRWRRYPRSFLNENRWRAQRYGIDGTLVDFGTGRQVRFADLIEELLELVREDAEALECQDEVQHARELLARGTGAHRQRREVAGACEQGADESEAMAEAVHALAVDTVADL